MSAAATRTRYAQCTLCEASCGLELTVSGPQDAPVVESVRGHAGDPLSRGHICPKAFALVDLHEDPDRLRRPVRRVTRPDGLRRPDDTWDEIGWDEAYDLAADWLASTQAEHGRDAVAVYLGNPTVHSLGAITHGTTLTGLLRTKNTYSATSLDQLPHQYVAYRLYGHQLLIPVPDIDRTELLVVLGGNPMASNGSIWTVPDLPQRVRDLKARGGRLVVLDPRRTETAKVATEHHFVRPASDAYVLLALLHVITTEGLATPAAYVDGVAAVADAVADLTPEIAARHSGVDAEVIRCLARDLASGRPAAIYGRLGVSVQRHGVICQWAIHTINVLTGNLDRPGGVLHTSPAIDLVGRGISARGHHDRWRSRVRGLPEFGGELPVAVLAEEITTPGEGQVRTLLTHAGNPVSSSPGGQHLAEAIRTLEHYVAIDCYLGETSSLADLVIPPTSPLQRDHYDLVFHVLATRNTARVSRAIYPTAPDERHDWQIFAGIVRRLLRARARARGRDLAAWRRSAAADLSALARVSVPPLRLVDVLLRTGTKGERRLSVRRLTQTPGGVDLGPLRPQLPGRLQTQDQRIDLVDPLVLAAIAELATPPSPPVSDGSLVLVGRRHLRDNNSWLHNTTRLTKGRPRHHLLVHPHDAAERGIADGGRARVTSAAGSVEVDVAVTDDVMPGVVSLPHGYGHGARAGLRLGHASALPGVSINDLTDPAVTETISGNAVLGGVPVSVEPA